jgi:hypothetical protein
MRAKAFVVSAAVIAATAACAAPTSAQRVGAPPTGAHAIAADVSPASRGTAVGLRGNASALAGHGELAIIAAHRLALLGGPVKALRYVALPGRATDPIWSSDGRWLAVRTSAAPPKSAPFETEPETLWLVNALGHVVRRLTSRGLDTTDAAWSPTSDRLAVATSQDGNTSHDAQVVEIGVSGHRRTLVTASYVAGIAWSPSGTQIAVSVNIFTTHWKGRLAVYPASSGAGHVVTASPENVLDLAGWWPDGSGLLAWVDPQGSGSIAADGLPLIEVPLATGTRHRLVGAMLQHTSWIAESRSHNEIAVIEGGDRELTLGHKALAICTTTHCSKLAQPADRVSFDPGWSPSGQPTVVRDNAVSPNHGFGLAYINKIEQSGGVNVVRSGTITGWPGVAADVTAPVWGRGGALLALHGRELVLLRDGDHHASPVAGPLRVPVADVYYGFVPWLESFAWSDTLPGGLEGTS